MVQKREFGLIKTGKTASLYTLKNKNGMEISVTDYGASLVSAKVIAKDGSVLDIVLGYDSAQEYENGRCFLGATIGRNANRIEQGRFLIDGKVYQVPQNEGENSLHSCPDGYCYRLWEAVTTNAQAENTISFRLESPDGDQGYPGAFHITVHYTLTDENEIILRYEGTADRPTIANMTNHSYFNLNGHHSGSILNHSLQILASGYTPVKDSKSIPTGEIASVEGTPFDFRTAKEIGRDIDAAFEQLLFGQGYDHNYAIDDWDGTLRKAAEAIGDKSGIRMDVYTDLPGVQLYTGNFIRHEQGKDGAFYEKRGAFCLETQYFPNAVNEPAFASPILPSDQPYQTTTIYQFRNS